MNKPTPYEQLLAAKLDQIPVPDMSDTIWSRIETQLDGVVPSPAKQPAPKIKELFIAAGTILTASVIVFYFATRHQPVKPVAPLPPSPPVEQVIPPDSIEVIPAPPVKKRSDTPMPVQEIAPPLPVPEDTLPALVPVQDTPVLLIPAPKVKKPKGVKGISSEDYQLSTKKDTVPY